MFTLELLNRVVGAVDCCPWGAATGRREAHLHHFGPVRGRPLYTPDERRRRDASRWTTVQGVLAPVQFAAFVASLFLVMRYLGTGNGLTIATGSVVAKTALLYTIMVTGAIWERDVFGRYLFARAFFWKTLSACWCSACTPPT